MKKLLITTALVLTISSNANAYDRFVKYRQHGAPSIEINYGALQYLQPDRAFGNISANVRPETIKKLPAKPFKNTENKPIVAKPVETAKPAPIPMPPVPPMAIQPVPQTIVPVITPDAPKVANIQTQPPKIIQPNVAFPATIEPKKPELKLPELKAPTEPPKLALPPVKAEVPAPLTPTPAIPKLPVPTIEKPKAQTAPVVVPPVNNNVPLEMPKLPELSKTVDVPKLPVAAPKAPAIPPISFDTGKADIQIPKFDVPKLPAANPNTPNVPALKAIKPVVAEVPAKAPEVKLPEIKAPEAKLPDIKVPDFKMPELPKPTVNAIPATTAAPALTAPKAATTRTSAPTLPTLPPLNAPSAPTANGNQVVLPPLFPADSKATAAAKTSSAAQTTASLPPVNQLFGTNSDKIEMPKLPTAIVTAKSDTKLADLPNIPAPKAEDVQINKDLAKAPVLAQAVPPAATTAKPTSFTFPFNETETELPLSEQGRLLEVADTLKTDKAMTLTVSAYASGTAEQSSQAKRTSLARALSVRRFMLERNVESSQIVIRPYGNDSGNGVPDRVDIQVGKKVGA